MEDAYSKVAVWLAGEYTEALESKFPAVLRAIFSSKSSVPLPDVKKTICDLASIAAERYEIPAVNWPWLDGHRDIHDNEEVYAAVSDILHITKGNTIFAFGNNRKLKWEAEKLHPRYFIAKERECHAAAPPGRLVKSYLSGTGTPVLLYRLFSPGEQDWGLKYEQQVRLKFAEDNDNYYWRVRPEIAIVTALMERTREVNRYVVSNILSMAFVQIVALQHGISNVKCDSEVLSMHNFSTDYVGGQLFALASTYSNVMQPRKYVDLPIGKLLLSAGLSSIDTVKVQNNRYLQLSAISAEDRPQFSLQSLPHLPHRELPMAPAYTAVAEWIAGNYGDSVESKFPVVLKTIFNCKSPVPLHDAIEIVGDLANLAEARFSMPIVNWPWLGENGALNDNHAVYSTIADVLKQTRDQTIYAYGNGLKLHWRTAQDYPRYFIAKNEDFKVAAPPGQFVKWYSGGTGKGITLTRVHDPEKRTPQQGQMVDRMLNKNESGYYWFVRPEVAIVCAIAEGPLDLQRFLISNIISMSFVQAVHFSRGASDVKCEEAVVSMCTSLSTEYVGGQIAALAAVYCRLMSPRGYKDMPEGKLILSAGLSQIDHMKLSNNLYWLRRLEEHTDGNGIKVQWRYKIFSVGNALAFRDFWRTLRWLCISVLVIVLIFISVFFQDVKWAEKMEKFLNLMFTVLIATVIGFAGLHTEENLLTNVLLSRRRIADVRTFLRLYSLTLLNSWKISSRTT